jgi:hypothetical protein
MRILYITPSFQHPSLRGPTRCYHFIKELSQRHSITLLSLSGFEVPAGPKQEMATYTNRIHIFSTNGASGARSAERVGSFPVIGGRLKQTLQLRDGVRQMKKVFLQLVKQQPFDVVLFHGKNCFPVIEDWKGLPLVVDFCDATSMRVLTKMQYTRKTKLPLLAMRYWQIRQVERRLVRKTPHVAFISRRDREAIFGRGSKSPLVPIGVDLTYWQRRSNNPKPNCLVFTGVMNYAPNEDAARYLIEKILPLIRAAVPDLQILLVGRDPSPALKAIAARYPDVIVTGFVDDVRDYLEQATIFVAPLRYASGIQNKVLEAMAMEVPVVATSIAADGLRVDAGSEPPIRVADGEKSFAENVVNLLGQAAERARLSSAGRRYVAEHFVWAQSAKQLEEMCLEAVARQKRDNAS